MNGFYIVLHLPGIGIEYLHTNGGSKNSIKLSCNGTSWIQDKLPELLNDQKDVWKFHVCAKSNIEEMKELNWIEITIKK